MPTPEWDGFAESIADRRLMWNGTGVSRPRMIILIVAGLLMIISNSACRRAGILMMNLGI